MRPAFCACASLHHSYLRFCFAIDLTLFLTSLTYFLNSRFLTWTAFCVTFDSSDVGVCDRLMTSHFRCSMSTHCHDVDAALSSCCV